MAFREKFGQETIAGTYKRPKWVPYYGMLKILGLCSGYSGSAQACSGLLRLGSGIPTLSSG